MSNVTVTRIIDATPDQVWAVLSDFPNIARWSSGLKGSHAMSDATDGLGAVRHCDFAGRGFVEERVTSWEPNQGYHVDFINTDAPITNANAGFRIEPHGDGRSKVTFAIAYEMKMGIIGKLMDAIMGKKQFAKNGENVLADLEKAIANGGNA